MKKVGTAAGESVKIQNRGNRVALLSRPASRAKPWVRLDFIARLRSIYGDKVLAATATQLMANERGDR